MQTDKPILELNDIIEVEADPATNESVEKNDIEAKQWAGPMEDRLALPCKHNWKPWQQTRARVKDCLLWLLSVLGSLGGLDWYCLGALGVLTALLSFFVDLSVSKMQRAHGWLFSQLEGYSLLQFLCWSLYPVSLCILSVVFSNSNCPQCAGSGVPEVRTMLSGIDLPDYLSLSHLFTKLVGLTCTLASGSTVFLGKVGPFVHLSTMLGAFLDQLCGSIRGERKFRAQGEMLVAAAAVGVASSFGAPVSGVLFSVEVMCNHFAVRDYCRCFFAAAFGALTFRLLSVWSREQETVQALFKTSFSTDLPYHPHEILVFSLLGLLCGASSCVFLFCHRWILHFVRTNRIISKIITTEKALYTGLVVFLLASVTFPSSAGHLMAAKLSMKQVLSSLLDNRQWHFLSQNATGPQTPEVAPESLWLEWSPFGTSIFLTLGVFLIVKFGLLILAFTLPMTAGYFMPVFIYGAAIGRLVGEGLAYLFPNGIYSGGKISPINPGGYALAGAAAFSGAVTHTLSPALLTLELTGQYTHAVPTLLATLIANALARSGHRPSMYDAVSLVKKLPHLPSLLRVRPELRSALLGPVGCAPEVVLESKAGLREVHLALSTSPDTEFPVVDTHDSRVLLGSVRRSELQRFLCSNADGPIGPGLDKQLRDECSIQPVTVQLSTQTTVQQAHRVMSVLCTQCLFVTEQGKLYGVMTWAEMKKRIEDLAQRRAEQTV